MKMPPQRIYNVFSLNVSPKSVQRVSVVFAFQCLRVWVVETHAPTGARAGWKRKIARKAAAELLWNASKINQKQVQANKQCSPRNFPIPSLWNSSFKVLFMVSYLSKTCLLSGVWKTAKRLYSYFSSSVNTFSIYQYSGTLQNSASGNYSGFKHK